MSTNGNLKIYKKRRSKNYGKYKIRFYLKKPTKGTKFVDLAILCERKIPKYEKRISSKISQCHNFLLLNSFKFSRNGLEIRIQDGALVSF